MKSDKKIGIVSPSWNGPGLFPLVFEKGISEVERVFNKEIVYSNYSVREILPTPEERAEDLHLMFENRNVDLIIASIGGNDSFRLLPFLNKTLIQANAKDKIFMGYSDSTTLLLYLSSLGVQTIHGPTVMSGFAEMSGISDELEKHIKDLFFKDKEEYTYPNFSFSTYANNPWEDPESFNTGITEYPIKNDWHILQPGVVEGKLFGGNLETIANMAERNLLEDFINDFDGSLLFLETSEQKPSIEDIERFMRMPTMLRILLRSKAIIFGYWSYYSPEEKEEIRLLIRNVLIDEFGYFGPIVTDLPIGHSRPQWLLLEGKKYSLDTASMTLSLKK